MSIHNGVSSAMKAFHDHLRAKAREERAGERSQQKPEPVKESWRLKGGLVDCHGRPLPPPEEKEVATPPGFEPVPDQPGFFYSPSRKLFWQKKLNKFSWFDEASQIYRDWFEGEHVPVVVLGAASSTSTAAADPAPKHVVINDLHQVAKALKEDLDHHERPASMLGVFGSSNAEGSVDPAVVARGVHGKLIARLKVDRNRWSDNELRSALEGALEDLSVGNGQQPLAVALVVGRRLFAVKTGGAHFCVVVQSGSCAEPHTVIWGANVNFGSSSSGSTNKCSSCCLSLDETVSPAQVLYCSLLVGESGTKQEETLAAVQRHLLQGRPRAASLSLMKDLHSRGSAKSIAAASVLIKASPKEADTILGPEPKKPKTASGNPLTTGDGQEHVRARQILLRYAAKDVPADKLVDPVRKKRVTRTLEEAEKAMLEVMLGFQGDSGATGFPKVCRNISECMSALKGGETAGDVGWLDVVKGEFSQYQGQKTQDTVRATVPPNVVKALADRRVGELTDIVVSSVGVHLLQRIG
eukprot:gnl/MRDRNA2_/MRDRNA2_134483_c0_seq1.p1 gnl/MRDRNA2_/MRDRNA2_134483_c0~~gnl/MRDRNA2_/MRDRNA2_134483_c0_seq1.p1  ORF type:complete len:525 (-),score=111.93 gnl/MRDRNA2_/MRDRNA2_134483_c0_seq1:99-1673(-)